MRERLGRAVKGNACPFLYLGRVRVKVLAKNSQATKSPLSGRGIAAYAPRSFRPEAAVQARVRMSAFQRSATLPSDESLGTRPDCGGHQHDLVRLMAKVPAGNPFTHPLEWARRCRIEAARAIHPSTKQFVLELAAQFEAIAGETVNLDPDDPELQGAVAERLEEIALRKKAWTR